MLGRLSPRRILSLLVGISVTIFPAIRATAQDQHPELFGEPSFVTVGAQRIETLWTEVTGKWSDSGENIGTNSTHIECYQKFGFCSEAEAYFFGGKAWVNYGMLDILRWDNRELIAIDSTPTCQVNQIRFDFKTKQVSATESPKGDVKDPFCKDVKATTAYLEGLSDELRRSQKQQDKKK